MQVRMLMQVSMLMQVNMPMQVTSNDLHQGDDHEDECSRHMQLSRQSDAQR